MKTSIITVNYGSTIPTKNLINSLEKFHDKYDITVDIIDNLSTKLSKKALNEISLKSTLKINLSYNEANLYYWPAVESLISKKYNHKKKYPDWLIICNNDVEFISEKFFNELSKLEKDKYSVVGPKIINQRGKDLNPFMVKPYSKFEKFYWKLFFKSYYFSKLLIFFSFLKNKFFNSKKKLKNQIKHKKVYAVHGSAIIFSNNFFKKKGILDNNFKLYAEEITTAEIAKKIGCSIFYVPELRLYHAEHSSINRINKKNLFNIAKESHMYIFNKYI